MLICKLLSSKFISFLFCTLPPSKTPHNTKKETQNLTSLRSYNDVITYKILLLKVKGHKRVLLALKTATVSRILFQLYILGAWHARTSNALSLMNYSSNTCYMHEM